MPDVSEMSARNLLMQGDFLRCADVCAALINNGVKAPGPRIMRGQSLLAQEGQASDALNMFDAALRIEPASGPAFEGKISAELRLGQIDAAEAGLAAAKSYEFPEATANKFTALLQAVRHGVDQGADGMVIGSETDLLLLGQVFNAVRRFDLAEAILNRSLEDGADGPAKWLAMTRTMGGLGRIDDIIENCRRMRDACWDLHPNRRAYYMNELIMLCRSLDQVRPDHLLTLALLGSALVEQTSTDQDGRNLINHVNRSGAVSGDLFLGAGIADLRGGRFDKAGQFFQKAAAGMPDFAEPRMLMNVVEVLEGGQANIGDQIAPDVNSALLMIAEGLGASGRYDDAVNLLKSVAEKAPPSLELQRALASMLSLLGRSDEALAASLSACQLMPGDASATMEVATNLLALGRLGEAWDLYDHRLKNWRRDSEMRQFPVPQWNGEDLAGKGLLIWREEGVGDELRVASLFPEISERLAGRVIVECDPRWRSLFERSFPGIEFRDEDIGNTAFNGVDFHIPLMSLLRFYRRDLRDFHRMPFLLPDPNRVDAWHQRLSELGPEPKIGIGWKSLNQSWRKRPLVTRLADWDIITGRQDLIMINLQCENHADEVADANRRLGREIHVFDDFDIKNDLEEAAALMAALDGIVGARCWVPSTAGAVGTKAFCATPKPNPFMADQNYDPWSSDTDIFYRQFKDDWAGVVSELNEALSDYLVSRERGHGTASGPGAKR